MPAAPTVSPTSVGSYNKLVGAAPTIPRAVQPFLGKPMFPAGHGADHHATGARRLAADHRRMAATNCGGTKRQQRSPAAEVLRVRKAFEAWDGRALTAADIDLLDRFIDFLFQTVGGVSAQAQRLALASTKDVGQALLALPAPARQQAQQALAIANGTDRIPTPFLAHLEIWKARTHLRGKSLHAAVAAVEEFAEAVPCYLETLTGGMVQKWIDDQLRPTDRSKPSLPSTVRKKVSGCRSYWTCDAGQRQGGQGAASVYQACDPRPSVPARERKEAEPLPFEVIDVPRLWQQAEGDTDLYAAIRIAAHTGMRREEICALTVDQVRIHEGIRYLFEVGDKTISAIRNVPIPTAIAPLIDELVANATSEGYLIHDGWKDKNGFRGGEVGSRFSKMKTAMDSRSGGTPSTRCVRPRSR